MVVGRGLPQFEARVIAGRHFVGGLVGHLEVVVDTAAARVVVEQWPAVQRDALGGVGRVEIRLYLLVVDDVVGPTDTGDFRGRDDVM
jgi:hypothetical protein